MNLARIREKIARIDRNLPRQVTGMLPSESFFCRYVDIPQGTDATDIAGFAQLQLEAGAPFPIENLSWGYLARDGKLLLYAAVTDRVSKAFDGSLEPLLFALPAFLPFALEGNAGKGTLRLCIAGHSASLVRFGDNESLPQTIKSCALSADLDATDETALLTARTSLLRQLGATDEATVEPGIRILATVTPEREDRLRFTVRHVTGSAGSSRGENVTLTIAGTELWNADARGRTFATQEKDRRRKDRLVWLAFAGAGCAAALLVLLLAILAVVKVASGFYQGTALTRMHNVGILQDKADFASNLESVTEREMKPFSMLAAASTCRPDGLFFEHVSANDWDELRVDGKARRADTVQNYIEALSASPYVSSAKNLRTTTSRGATSFEIEIIFNPLDDLSDGK